ncbi:MAG: PKD domain-containing protein, partial [Marinoscillum sp.]
NDDPGTTTPSRSEALKLVSANTTYSWDLVKTKDSDWVGWSVNFSGNIWHRVTFDTDCNASIGTSVGEQAATVSYHESGVYSVGVKVTGKHGTSQVSTTQVTVTEDVAPDIDFDVDDSRCLANANLFSSVSSSSNVKNYSWDFNGDAIEDSVEPNPEVNFDTLGGPGTYSVQLMVTSTGGCTNVVEKDLTLYNPPPTPGFEIVSDVYCIGTEIQIANTTDDDNFGDGISYLWSITDFSDTLTSGDIFVSFAQPGQKIIKVQSLIPGCESVLVSDTIMVSDNPGIDFSTSSICEGEVTFFTVLTDGAGYTWDFGDGYISTADNPEHLYNESGNYFVTLSTTNANGCVNTITKEVVVSSLPEPQFEYDIICEGEQTTLRDVSIVDGADIAQWEWFVEDLLVSNQKSPEIIFSSDQEQLVTLKVYATNGCSASYTESISVMARPDANFISSIACLGSNSVFYDISSNQNQIANRSWMINGQLLNSDNDTLAYSFSQPGTYEISLIVDNENLCTGSMTQFVEIKESPIVDFTQHEFCENETISVSDQSSFTNDPIISRSWYLEGEKIGNGLQALVPAENEGQYQVSLNVTTAFGCVINTTKTVEVRQQPGSSFTASNDFGVPPFEIQMNNLTENGSIYEWYVNNDLVSTDQNPLISFESEGSKEIKLVSTNEDGCTDSTSLTIESIFPEVDLAIEALQLQDNGNGQTILLSIRNGSNLPIEHIEATITLEDEFELSETIHKRFDPGKSQNVSLNTKLPTTSGLGYLCVSLSSIYTEDEVDAVNNEECINIGQAAVFEPAFPNPTSGITRVRAIIPETGAIKLSLLDLTGQLKQTVNIEYQPSGLTTFKIDLTEMESGTYFVIVEFEGGSHKSKVVKK